LRDIKSSVGFPHVNGFSLRYLDSKEGVILRLLNYEGRTQEALSPITTMLQTFKTALYSYRPLRTVVR
jgi:hypothetical protein